MGHLLAVIRPGRSLGHMPRVIRLFRAVCAPLVLGALFAPTLASAQRPTRASGSSAVRPSGVRHGFATDRLSRIDSMLERAVEREEVAGPVALVLRDDAVAVS